MRRKLSTAEIKKRLREGAYHDGSKPLSEKRVQRLRGAGRYHDGLSEGLYLSVNERGRKSWLLRYEIDGVERMMGLGSADDFSLAEARTRARAQRQLIADGIDPLVAKRDAKAAAKAAAARRLNFAEAAEKYFRQHQAEWRSVRHAKQWIGSLRAYAFPVIGDMDVAAITTPDVLKVIEPSWNERTVTLDRVRNRIESVLDWATVRGHRQGDNAARWKGHLSEVLAAPSKIAKPQNLAALKYVSAARVHGGAAPA
jgi:hypothetical protein